MREKMRALVQLNQCRLKNQHQTAIDICMELLVNDRNDADVMAVLATLYHELAFINTELINQLFEQAIFWIDEAIKIQSQTADFYAIRGQIYLNFPDYVKAVNDFRIALQIKSDLLSACFGLGFLARVEKEIVKVDEAIEAITKAAKTHTDNPLLFSELHGLLTIAGQINKANQALSKAFLCSKPLPEKYT